MTSLTVASSLALLISLTPEAMAVQALSVKSTGGGEKARTVKINKFTIYTPKTGGINGSCGGGALGKGVVEICKKLLEPYVKNPSQGFVAAAVPCKGSTAANAFGGIYKSDDLKGATHFTGGDFMVAAVDHYKCGGHGQGGKAGSDGTERMDVAAESENSAPSQAVQNAKGAELNWQGTFEQFRNGQININRNNSSADRASVDQTIDSLLAENDKNAEDLLNEAIYASELAKRHGRTKHLEQSLVAFDGEMPWMILGRKNKWAV
ncbi:MAG: hypothetical protein ACXWR1_06025 [Bdellovibrionota bacterium]